MRRLRTLRRNKDFLTEMIGEKFYHVSFGGVTEHTLDGYTANYAKSNGKKIKKENCFFSKEDAEERLLRSYINLFKEKHISLLVVTDILNDLVEKYPEYLV